MAWGFNPYLMEADQFAGAYLSVVESIAKLVAAGFEHKARLSLLPGVAQASAHRGRALGQARQPSWAPSCSKVDLGAGAIGGKDSVTDFV